MELLTCQSSSFITFPPKPYTPHSLFSLIPNYTFQREREMGAERNSVSEIVEEEVVEVMSSNVTRDLPLLSLNHVSFVCKSVKKSVQFYEQVLGFVLIKRPSSFDFEGAWYVCILCLHFHLSFHFTNYVLLSLYLPNYFHLIYHNNSTPKFTHSISIFIL